MAEKDKVVFQTRSRTVTLPKFNQEEYSDSEDEDYEPSSGSEEEEELVGRKRSTNKTGGNTPKKQKVIDLEAEVIDLDNEENENKDNVNKIWEEMNKNENNNTNNIIQVHDDDNKKDNKQNNKDTSNNINKEQTDQNNNNVDKENENKSIDNNCINNDENNNNPQPLPTTSTSTSTSNQNESIQKESPPLQQQETEIVEYAGEKIEIKKQPPKPQPALSKKKSGLDSLLSNLSKPKKINTLEKSKLDWDKHKNQDMNENEKHRLEQQKKDGYLEKEAFLQRTGENQYQEKLNLLKKLNK